MYIHYCTACVHSQNYIHTRATTHTHRVMDSLPYPELPPLAYQLLVLSTRGHKSLVLEGLQTLFNQLDTRALQGREEEEEGERESWGRWVCREPLAHCVCVCVCVCVCQSVGSGWRSEGTTTE